MSEADVAEAGSFPEFEQAPRLPLRRRRWKVLIGAIAALVAVAVILSSVLFVWPRSDRIRPVGAVLELNGPSGHQTTAEAISLVEHGVAPVLLLSVSIDSYRACPDVPRVRVVCFVPQPNRTVGEMDFAESYAREHGIGSILVVAGHAQTTRARLLAHRCFSGKSYVVAADMGWDRIPYAVVYEWLALAKALVVDRGCD